MNDAKGPTGGSGWICNACREPLAARKVRLQYRASIFPIELPACPKCGIVLIDEELAVGNMAEAEQILEDK